MRTPCRKSILTRPRTQTPSSSGSDPSNAGRAAEGSLLFALASVAFASMASVRIADPMLPRLASDFARTPAEAASVITGFALAYGLMQLVTGPAGDLVGKLRIICAAALAAAAGSLLCAAAPTLPWLIGARFITGACCAAIIPLSLAWIGDTVAYARRQETLARFATGTLLGLVAGQAFGGIAADTIGWRGAFATLAVLFAVFGWRVAMLARRTATPVRETQSAAGDGSPGPAGGQLRAYRSILGSRWARFVLATAFAEGALLFGALAFVPTWLHLRFGMPLSAAGMMVAVVGLGGLAYTSMVKHWIRLLGERGLATAGGLVIGIGLVSLAIADQAGPQAMTLTVTVVAACFVVGFGFYMLHNTLQTVATQLAPHARGTAVGLFAVSLFVGQSLGVAGAAAIAARAGYAWTIGGAGVLLALLGCVLGAALLRRLSAQSSGSGPD
jgi:MFS transporter, YNFM family, putative membrane transport protein